MQFEKIHNKGQAQLFKNPLPGILNENPSVCHLGYVCSRYCRLLLYYSTVLSDLPALQVIAFNLLRGCFFGHFLNT